MSPSTYGKGQNQQLNLQVGHRSFKPAYIRLQAEEERTDNVTSDWEPKFMLELTRRPYHWPKFFKTSTYSHPRMEI